MAYFGRRISCVQRILQLSFSIYISMSHKAAYVLLENATAACGHRPQGFLSDNSQLKPGKQTSLTIADAYQSCKYVISIYICRVNTGETVLNVLCREQPFLPMLCVQFFLPRRSKAMCAAPRKGL